MTDDQLAAFVLDLVRWEGSTTWLYRDTLGYATIGIGNLVHDADEAIRLPFYVGDREATPGEIQREFLRVIGQPKGHPAGFYRASGSPELTDHGVTRLAIGRLRNEFIPGLTRLFIGFEDFPLPAQSALVDMCWNLGVTGLSQFSHLLAAIADRDWKLAAYACHVKTSRDDRNSWRSDMFLKAA